jgi:hypothetical protein
MTNHPAAAHGHMPFAGHRTQKEVREDIDARLYGRLPEWCPQEYREQFYHLQRKCGFTIDEVRALVESQIATDNRRSASA